MTDIILSFDTEDFTSNVAADAIVREAELLRSYGVKGCFCLVGLLAKQLKEWNRTDVIEALGHHEIDLHTYGHTLHPMINEYTDTEDFEQARSEVVRQETEAIRLIEETTGVGKVYAAVPPGNQKSYAAMYAYADMGIPIYADTFCDPESGIGSYYCNIFHVDYSFGLEGVLFDGGEKEIRQRLDELSKKRRAVIYTHPQYSMFEESWDIKNYDKENLCEYGKWLECKRHPIEKTEKFFENLELLIKILKSDDRFRIITYKELAGELEKEPARVISRKDLPEIKAQLEKSFYPTTHPDSYSLSDIFRACQSFLKGNEKYVCSKVYGILDEPYAAESEITVTAEEVKASADSFSDEGFLPEKIRVGAYDLGAADWLYAALDVLCGAGSSKVLPKNQLPSLDELPLVRDCSFKGTWRHSDSFEDKYLSDRLRRQSWTMRFPK